MGLHVHNVHSLSLADRRTMHHNGDGANREQSLVLAAEDDRSNDSSNDSDAQKPNL